jgi:D-alanine-D-alanine ligase-like ATP-grasp enzyme
MEQSELERIYYSNLPLIYQEAIDAQPLTTTVLRSTKNSGNPEVHLLVPNFVSKSEVRSEMERISHNYGKKAYLDELFRMFEEINREAVIHLLRMIDYKQVIDAIPKGVVILNLCDGSDVDGVPGPGVSRYLEEKGIPYFGCDYVFTESTTSKQLMKLKFQEKDVSTAKFTVITKDKPLTRESVQHMTYPLFVKACDSYGSIGLTSDSVVHTFEDLQKQVGIMQQTFSSVLVEEFIDGAEYSLLVIGDSRFPDSELEVFPPAQRVFDERVPEKERFLSYKLVWEEGGIGYKYASVEKDSELLMDLAKRAYDSVGGNGYGRIDVRRRDSTNDYFVLEVNAMCGVGFDSSSAQILKLKGKGIAYFLERVLSIGGNDPSKKNQGKSLA